MRYITTFKHQEQIKANITYNQKIKSKNTGENKGPQRKCHTHLGTVESLVTVVGSSSKTDAMSCP